MNGVDLAQAAYQILHPNTAPADQRHGWTLDQAAQRIEHLNGTPDQWREAVAYLACQVHCFERMDGERDRLALTLIRTILANRDSTEVQQTSHQTAGLFGGVA